MRKPRAGAALMRVSAVAVVLLFAATSVAGALSLVQPVSPAPDRPLGAPCSHALVHDADGNVTPLRCSPTQFNIQAWRWYARVRPAPVLALSRTSPLAEVKRALCRTQRATLPMRISEYTLASTYNDWHFSTSAVSSWVLKACS